MNKLLHIIILLLSTSLALAQEKDCVCFDGIGSTSGDRPALTMEFENGRTLVICGFEVERYSLTRIVISEFNVFDCQSGESLTEYGAMQTCEVQFKNDSLTITELKYLPVGKKWEWELVPIGRQRIVLDKNKLQVSTIEPFYRPTTIDSELVDRFYTNLEKLKGEGYNEQFESIIGKLEVLALNGKSRALRILTDFDEYFNFTPDGAIAMQLSNAVATVDWIRNK